MSWESTHRKFHETWLGMVQPIEGLVVSLPVLVEAECMDRQSPETQKKLLEQLTTPDNDDNNNFEIADVEQFLEQMLDLKPSLFDTGDALPDDLSLYVPEGGQTIRPTRALRKLDAATSEDDKEEPETNGDAPAVKAGANYVALFWDLPNDVDLDKPETTTGSWEYPPSAKFDRLLRHTRVPIGVLTNRKVVRLIYAPHGESSGHINFNVTDMATVGGRPILDAFIMLLSGYRFFGEQPDRRLPALLAESRKRQANVTEKLATQVLEALEILLAGFEAAADRDGWSALNDALAREDDTDHVYGGLLTVLLRLVFVLYAEDRNLMPTDADDRVHDLYAENFSVLGLFDELQADHGAFPDSMDRRFGAWSRLIALFRAVFLGVDHGDFEMPPRRGRLFDPHAYPFLEGWGPAGSAPITLDSDRAQVRVPSIDDHTVFRILEKLILLDGQRLSYGTLDVEQIGSVYEGLMGYHVVRLDSPAVCTRPKRVWVEVDAARAQPNARALTKWIKQAAQIPNARAKKLAELVEKADTDDDILEALETNQLKGTRRKSAGALVIQPGEERRRTSSHYTPRSLTAPIVEKTLEPLLNVMGPEPSSERLLELKICDPAMGSGAFLVEACRYLANQLELAWTRENKIEKIADAHEHVTNHARRLVAQRCLYGVDKNPFAVELAKLSLWLVTLAKNQPFTFLDHALRHGDSLVGLDFEQIRSFHWDTKKEKQLEWCRTELDAALNEAIGLRQQILDLAADDSKQAARQKEHLLWDARDALKRVRLLADLVVAAFFNHKKNKDRKTARNDLLDRAIAWLQSDDYDPPPDLTEIADDLRQRVPTFHWMLEFPEVFYAERPDPLDNDQVNRAADMDAFVGNPPFMGGKRISTAYGNSYTDWLQALHATSKNADIAAHFFRRAAKLLGKHGTTSLIATNTISQGETRNDGLKPLLGEGFRIYAARQSVQWPGSAAVVVSVVHFGVGNPVEEMKCELDGRPVPEINSRLRPSPERPNPEALQANRGFSFQGSIVFGTGFILSPEQRERLVSRDQRNAERIFPYIGGEEVNTSPTQEFHRYVINFAQLTQSEAEAWPDLMEILAERVAPERKRKSRSVAESPWWQHWRARTDLYDVITDMHRCFVIARHSKTLAFVAQPTDRVFSEALVVIATESFGAFAVLQSRIHSLWARFLGSSLKDDLRYSPTDCFETFPFPVANPQKQASELNEIGEELHTQRAACMAERNLGLTQLYACLRASAEGDTELQRLRDLHLKLDQAVLHAYGWSDIDPPPYGGVTAHRIASFEHDVLDRLLLLNYERRRDERIGSPTREATLPIKSGKRSSNEAS